MRKATPTLATAGTRAVVYARYSSDSQRDASIEDQIRQCRGFVEREGWSYVVAYADHAMSGSIRMRPAYQKLLEDARRGEFDIVVAEGLDRLSRDQEDIAGLYKNLSFAGIKLVTIAEGEVNELHVGLKGTMNALFLKDLAQKTWRGLEGRVRAGRSGGGLCYGYDVVRVIDGERGQRRVNDGDAAIVLRIFTEFAAGKSPRAIATHLNHEGILGPRGKSWGPSAIHGNWRRGTGILNNDLYVGRLVWNRQRFVKDVTSGKRQARLNPESKWLVEDVAGLRIVPDELWATVKQRQKSTRRTIAEGRQTHPERARRPAYLFSGLIKCAACGGGFSMISATLYGCSNARNRGTCTNRSTIRRDALEESVLQGLRDHLMHPDLVKEFMAEYHRELNKHNATAEHAAARRVSDLARVKREIAKLIQAIKDGVPATSIKDEFIALEQRKELLERDIAKAPEPAPRLHPNLAEIYRQKVANLRDALNDEATRTEAATMVRELVDRIQLAPDQANGLQIELVGDLARILAFTNKNPRRADPAGAQVTMVAGTGFEPVTFRL